MLSDDEFRQLLDAFNRPWKGYRKVRKGVKKRIRRHMSALGCSSIEEYLPVLFEHPEEKKQLEACLWVTISRFYRDPSLWETLSNRILPDLAKQFEPPIRIWSAGCANGEEPFSIAMAWTEINIQKAIDILASDVNHSCLERARKGVYPRSSLKNLSEEMRDKYFLPKKGGRSFSIRMERLPAIRWRQHNGMNPITERSAFHMIFLRNSLLTYIQAPDLTIALHRILETLVPGGYLITGSHERLPETRFIMSRDDKCPFLYRLAESSHA